MSRCLLLSLPVLLAGCTGASYSSDDSGLSSDTNADTDTDTDTDTDPDTDPDPDTFKTMA